MATFADVLRCAAAISLYLVADINCAGVVIVAFGVPETTFADVLLCVFATERGTASVRSACNEVVAVLTGMGALVCLTNIIRTFVAIIAVHRLRSHAAFSYTAANSRIDTLGRQRIAGISGAFINIVAIAVLYTFPARRRALVDIVGDILALIWLCTLLAADILRA